jgi:hypothetical protein
MKTTTITLASGAKVMLVTEPQLFVIERAADGAFIDWHGPVKTDTDVRMLMDLCAYNADWHYKDGRTAHVEKWTETDLWNITHDEKVEVTR